MKVFVTGGTGFIGTQVVRRLAKDGHQLYCLARSTSQTDALRRMGAEIVFGDVTDRPSLLEGMKGCDWVANLANFFEFWTSNRRIYRDMNVTGTRNVMEAAVETGASKVLHVSTMAIFGNAKWPVSENSELGENCASEYARTKREGDQVAWDLYRQQNLPLVMIYPGAVLGPGDRKAAGRYIGKLARGKMPAQVFTDSVFPWVHVRDVAEAIVLALEKKGNVGQKYVVVAESLTFGRINRMVSELSERKLPRFILPDFATIASAHLCTWLAYLTRRPPLLDLAIDEVRLLKQGCQADGSKAARELGLTYTPIRLALEDEIAGVKSGRPQPVGA